MQMTPSTDMSAIAPPTLGAKFLPKVSLVPSSLRNRLGLLPGLLGASLGGWLVALTATGFLGSPARAQVLRGAVELPDVYEFAPPLDYKIQYKHDPQNKKMILNPDFFCSQCAREKRIPYEHRDEMRGILEKKVIYPYEFQGRHFRKHGLFRMAEQDGDQVLDYLFKQIKARRPIFLEDENFRIFVDLDGFSTKKHKYRRRAIELKQLGDIFPGISEKTVQINSHHRAHLYLIRAQRVLRDFVHLTKFHPDATYMQFKGPYLGVDEKYEIYIFRKQVQAGWFMNAFLGHPQKLDGECWHTLQDDSMMAIMHGENLPDVWLNNTFTHRMAYNFLAGFRGYHYDLPSWFQLGFGHLMERRERTDFNTFFFGEGRIPDEVWGQSKWKPDVRKWVAKGKVRPLVEIAQFTHENEITPSEHGVVWSLTSYLMSLGNDKFGRFLHILKEKKKGETIYNLQVRAFRSVYNLSMTQFFEDWQKWVLKTYPPL